MIPLFDHLPSSSSFTPLKRSWRGEGGREVSWKGPVAQSTYQSPTKTRTRTLGAGMMLMEIVECRWDFGRMLGG